MGVLPNFIRNTLAMRRKVSVDAIRATRIHSRSLLRFLAALLVNLDLATALSRTRDNALTAHLVDTLIIQRRLFVSNASRGSMAFHSAQAMLMNVNLASQVSMLRRRDQVVVWSVPLGVLVLVPVLLHIYHVLSADTIVSQVKRTVLLARGVNMVHTEDQLYVWTARRVSSDLVTVASLIVSARIVPLASLAPQMVYIRAPLVVRLSISPSKDSLRVVSAKV